MQEKRLALLFVLPDIPEMGKKYQQLFDVICFFIADLNLF